MYYTDTILVPLIRPVRALAEINYDLSNEDEGDGMSSKKSQVMPRVSYSTRLVEIGWSWLIIDIYVIQTQNHGSTLSAGLVPGKKEWSSVVEFGTTLQANGAADEGLAIGAELYRCTMINAACTQKQCFKFHQHGYVPTHCTHIQACNYSASSHQTLDCKKNTPRKLKLWTGPHETWDNGCEHESKKLKRMGTARENKDRRRSLCLSWGPTPRLLPLSRYRSFLCEHLCHAIWLTTGSISIAT